ncbi:hypothetical protein [Novosphingobium sp. KN65.2]|uniref:hypothetical protein n=1 Tax=Novosphingobium sp. KN65.2 TaxID=1478134 RepID=UPI0005E53EBE|nr:hypothetical protein [Novosphingobium sp. KN65.2]CDO34039.1 conserved hypothetical protein [Novosphingobium sp. KN65.2]
MTDLTLLSDADAGSLATGYMYLWVPGTPASQYKVAISDLVTLGLATAAWKEPVRAATVAAGTLASGFENGDTIDGVVLATGDRILIKDQAAPAENGIYTVNASGAPSRAQDADTGSELVNATVAVSEGTTNADKIFTCTTNASITLGTTALTFVDYLSSARASHNPQAASYTLALTDAGKLVSIENASANNLTVPANASVAFPIGTRIDVGQYGAGQTTLVADTGVTIRSSGGNLKLTGQYSGATLQKIGTNEWWAFGDLSA